MKVFIYANGLEIADKQRLWLHAELAAALASFGRSIGRVNLYLQDNNGTKGGIDKSCRLVVHVRRQPSVVIEDRDLALHPLIARVIERAEQVLRRKFTRRRSRSGSVSMSGE